MLHPRRLLGPLAIALLLAPLAACGPGGGGDDDDDDDDDDDSAIDAPAGDDAAIDAPTAEDARIDAVVVDVDAAIDGGEVNVAPVINEITWTPNVGCSVGTPSNYAITLDVTDESPGTLIYSGGPPSCGTINSNPDSISCPNVAPYQGTVVVTDNGGLTDSQSITISPCTAGSAP